MREGLLWVHIIAGMTGLVSALVAVVTRWAGRHRAHVWSGRVFFGGMMVAVATAVPLALLGANVFLLLIALFSGYLAFSGWRAARHRSGEPAWVDLGAAGLMLAASVVMLGYGGVKLYEGHGLGLPLMVFGAIGGAVSAGHLRRWRRGEIKGRERIAHHLTMMLGATIAAVTAFVVTNITFEPSVVLWLAPTALITPLIVAWSRRVRGEPREPPAG